jgi:hypothetical protein
MITPLLSTDITKVKRLSLKEIKAPYPPSSTNPPKELPPTEEEITFSRLVATNPLLEELVNRLDLVSSSTGERIRLVNTVNRII